MKKKLLAVISALALLLSICACASEDAGVPSQDVPTQSPPAGSTLVPSSEPTIEPTPEPTPEPQPIVVHLMAAGDIMTHLPITQDAYVAAFDEYDYSHMLTDAAKQLAQADYAVANLETPLAGGPNSNYSGYPSFNAPDALAYDVKNAGIDLVSTANNHTRDRYMSGVYRTLDVLDEAGLAHVGSYRSQEERDANTGIYVADVGGISVAFLCYTYGLNGYTIPNDQRYAVNLYTLDYDRLETYPYIPDYELLTADLEAARALNADLIAVLIHWGEEYYDTPRNSQIDLAQFLVGQGADLVLGNHPHVLEPYETITVTGWDGQEREGFVSYSLGNFISNQYSSNAYRNIAVKTTAILDLELTKTPDGKASLTNVTYTPYFMLHRDGAPAGDRRYLLNIHDAMAAYEAGDTSLVNAAAYQDLQSALARCHNILGAEGDAGQALTVY